MKKTLLLFTIISILISSHAQIGGSLDLSFNTTGYYLSAINNGVSKARAIALLDDGSFLVTGSVYSASTGNDVFVLKLDSTGKLVTTFGVNGVRKVDVQTGSEDIGYSIAVDETTGKFFVGGSSNNGTKQYGTVLKFNANGSLDNTFGSSGKVVTSISGTNSETFFKIKFHAPTGNVVATGTSVVNANNTSGFVVRYKPSGNLDSTFATNGIANLQSLGKNIDELKDVLVFPNGKIVVGGSCFDTNWNSDYGWVVQINSNGTIDNSFGTNGQTLISHHTQINSMLLDVANSKIYLGGGNTDYFGFSDKTTRVMLSRISTNGTTDSWNYAGTISCCKRVANYYEGFANAVVFNPAGGFFLAGEGFETNENVGFVAKFKSDGSDDYTFGPEPDNSYGLFVGATDNAKLFDLVLQPDNKIVVAGYVDNDLFVARLFGTTVPQLDSFKLLSPANNSTELVNNDVELDWSDAIGAEKYEISIDTLQNFSTAKTFERQSSIAFTYELDLDINKTFYWRIRAKSGNKVGAWKGPWKFSTVTDLLSLVSPANGATNVNPAAATFDWSDAKYSTANGFIQRYNVEVATNQNFTNAFSGETDLPQSSYLSNNQLAFNTTYYWRVRTRRANKYGPWSPTFSFTTINPTSVDELIDGEKIVIVPNPATNIVRLVSTQQISDNDIAVYDIRGSKMDIEFIDGKADVGLLSNGIYYISIRTKSTVQMKSFVKQK